METSQKYKSMIYFAVATFFFYSKNIIYTKEIDVNLFRENNPELVKRIFDECLSVMNYELSNNQVDTAILAYLQSYVKPQSVHDTSIYKPKYN